VEFACVSWRDETAAARTGVYMRRFHPYLSAPAEAAANEGISRIMRPEIQTQLDNAKQSIGLLRRHL
jgi:hypothetical protein